MIAEPYICTKGPQAGTIEWLDTEFSDVYLRGKFPKTSWQPYADFEREKLREICGYLRFFSTGGYSIAIANDERGFHAYESESFTGYTGLNYASDSESSRLLKRADFLKAVCEKEVVGWLPSQPIVHCDCPLDGTRHERCGGDIPRTERDIVKEVCGDEPVRGEPGSYGLCDICGTRIKFENEQIAGHHFACSNLKHDFYTKAEIDKRMRMLWCALIGMGAGKVFVDRFKRDFLS